MLFIDSLLQSPEYSECVRNLENHWKQLEQLIGERSTRKYQGTLRAEEMSPQIPYSESNEMEQWPLGSEKHDEDLNLV